MEKERGTVDQLVADESPVRTKPQAPRSLRQWLSSSFVAGIGCESQEVSHCDPPSQNELDPLGLTSPRPFLDLSFDASSQALLEVARDPQRLDAEIRFLSILHTWSSNLLVHYHVHAVVPAGGLSADHPRWIPTSHPISR
jgi:hypothetical protein